MWRERSKDQGIRPLLKSAEASVSCGVVNKSFNLSETHMIKGIMLLQGYYESLLVSNFLFLFLSDL